MDWCARSDLNRHCTASRTAPSADWGTRTRKTRLEDEVGGRGCGTRLQDHAGGPGGARGTCPWRASNSHFPRLKGGPLPVGLDGQKWGATVDESEHYALAGAS